MFLLISYLILDYFSIIDTAEGWGWLLVLPFLWDLAMLDKLSK